MSARSEPELSVIVATHNRRELLLRCLDSLPVSYTHLTLPTIYSV